MDITSRQAAAATSEKKRSVDLNSRSSTTPISSAVANFDLLPDIAFVRLPTVVAVTSLSAATVWRYVLAGRLPQPQKLGPNVTAWKVGELRRAIGAFSAAATVVTAARKVAA